MKELGILLDENNDLQIMPELDESGMIDQGWELGNTTLQNMGIIIRMHPGELKEYPTCGVGIANLALSHDTLYYKHKIRQQLTIDGYRINSLSVIGDEIDVDANYEQ